MVVVCIDNDYYGFTYGKSYEVNNRGFTMNKGIEEDNDWYELYNDMGLRMWAVGKYFERLEEYRDKQLNKILEY